VLDLQSTRLETHRRDLDRYSRLLATELTAVEREYIHKRIAEERTELDCLLALQRQMTDDMNAVDQVPTSIEGGTRAAS
jgi:bacterioferritin (cytochrome b1)